LDKTTSVIAKPKAGGLVADLLSGVADLARSGRPEQHRPSVPKRQPDDEHDAKEDVHIWSFGHWSFLYPSCWAAASMATVVTRSTGSRTTRPAWRRSIIFK